MSLKAGDACIQTIKLRAGKAVTAIAIGVLLEQIIARTVGDDQK
ncbi:MAG: hypothetical protein WBO93_16800 [Gammaproteobacteria bacterium]